MTKLNSTLVLISNALNNAGVCWALGGSVLLRHYQLVSHPHDIDVLVHLDDIEKARLALDPLGVRHPRRVSDQYSTQYFDKYTIEGIGLDVMAGLIIHRNGGQYAYPFNDASIASCELIEGVVVPLMYLEDWRILYALMGRQSKATILDAYFAQPDRLDSQRLQAIWDDVPFLCLKDLSLPNVKSVAA